uniref:Uncharacterized protein n=1 Tax=Ananas comosus var. bracteatus TaxID=296719 RepID=A0A6V7P9X0_ANACO|nr:unnamed protein product [Ananas comosus var. bracteatus]
METWSCDVNFDLGIKVRIELVGTSSPRPRDVINVVDGVLSAVRRDTWPVIVKEGLAGPVCRIGSSDASTLWRSSTYCRFCWTCDDAASIRGDPIGSERTGVRRSSRGACRGEERNVVQVWF